MTSERLVCIVVVAWNNADDTLHCLQSLAPLAGDSVRVIMVDNGSTDGSGEVVANAFPAVTTMFLSVNEGYAAGCNAGFHRAVAEGAAYVVFLNNDTVVDPGFLDPLLKVLDEHGEVKAALPQILYAGYPDRIWYDGGALDPSRGIARHTGIRKKSAGSGDGGYRQTGYATGCCLVMRCMDFQRIGGFDTAAGMYGEDLDLSMRIREEGGILAVVPASRIWHRVSASSGGELGLPKLVARQKALVQFMHRWGGVGGVTRYLLRLPFDVACSAASIITFRLMAALRRRRAA